MPPSGRGTSADSSPSTRRALMVSAGNLAC
jgi:hypothetical protein